MRPRTSADIEERAVFGVMRDLAARSRALAADAKRYEQELAALVRSLHGTLLDEPGIGPISAAKLLACDPARFKHEAAFARCNGTAPLPASSAQDGPAPTQPRRRPPGQQRDPHDRGHPRQTSTRDVRLPRPPLEASLTHLAGVTANPSGTRVCQQARTLAWSLADRGRPIRLLIADRQQVQPLLR
jgi:hypothetical protein